MVKRSSSDSPPPSPTPPTTPRTKTKIPSAQTAPNKSSGNARISPGDWTGDKKAALIDHLISVGLAHCKLDDLAVECDLSKTQLSDATKKSRPNNLRSKVVACASSI